MSDDWNRHDPNRTCAGDEHVFSEHRKRKRRMNGITERIEDCSHLLIDLRVVPPDIRHGQRDELSEGPWAVDANALRVGAEMPSPCKAVSATTADDMAFTAHDIARMEVVYIRADFHDLPDKFVTDGHRDRDGLLCPLVPLVNVDIRSADTGMPNTDQYIIDADKRLCNLF
jgi:hypothetical protein